MHDLFLYIFGSMSGFGSKKAENEGFEPVHISTSTRPDYGEGMRAHDPKWELSSKERNTHVLVTL